MVMECGKPRAEAKAEIAAGYVYTHTRNQMPCPLSHEGTTTCTFRACSFTHPCSQRSGAVQCAARTVPSVRICVVYLP